MLNNFLLMLHYWNIYLTNTCLNQKLFTKYLFKICLFLKYFCLITCFCIRETNYGRSSKHNYHSLNKNNEVLVSLRHHLLFLMHHSYLSFVFLLLFFQPGQSPAVEYESCIPRNI